LCSLQYDIPSAQALVHQEWSWVELHTMKSDVFTDISSSVLTIIILNKKLILYLATAYFVLSYLCSINSFMSDKHLPVCFCNCLCLSSELTFLSLELKITMEYTWYIYKITFSMEPAFLLWINTFMNMFYPHYVTSFKTRLYDCYQAIIILKK